MPTKVSIGKVMSVPPPASALTSPAPSAANAIRRYSTGVTGDSFQVMEGGMKLYKRIAPLACERKRGGEW
jgi:hypothetical protein